MPRGKGHAQRRGDAFRMERNEVTMAEIRANLFENLLGVRDFGGHGSLDGFIAHMERQLGLGEKIEQDLSAVILAADAYESDAPLFESFDYSNVEDSVEPLQITVVFHDVHEQQWESAQVSCPVLCDDHHMVTVSSFPISDALHEGCRQHDIKFCERVIPKCESYGVEQCTHRLAFQEDIKECRDLINTLNSATSRGVQSCIGTLPPEVADIVESNLSCREKFILSTIDGIPRRGCGKGRTLLRDPPNYSKIPPLLGCSRRFDSCVCSSRLFKNPKLFWNPLVRWALKHATWKTRKKYFLGNYLHVGRHV